jgi:hypothetical protein
MAHPQPSLREDLTSHSPQASAWGEICEFISATVLMVSGSADDVNRKRFTCSKVEATQAEAGEMRGFKQLRWSIRS